MAVYRSSQPVCVHKAGALQMRRVTVLNMRLNYTGGALSYIVLGRRLARMAPVVYHSLYVDLQLVFDVDSAGRAAVWCNPLEERG